MSRSSLPRGPKYRVWNSKKVAALVLSDPDLQEYVTVMDEYVFNLNTVAAYNYRDEPLAGKYKSVIFDKQEGIILCPLSTKQILNRLAAEGVSGILFHKTVSRMLGYNYYHAVSFGHSAYFSTRGYVGQNATDWAGLHNFADYHVELNSLTLSSIPIAGLRYFFVYHDCTRNIGSHLRHALHLNEHNHQLIHHYIERHGYEAFQHCTLSNISMLGNRIHHRIHHQISATLPEIMEKIDHDSHLHCLRIYDNELGFSAQLADHKIAYLQSKRIRSVQ